MAHNHSHRYHQGYQHKYYVWPVGNNVQPRPKCPLSHHENDQFPLNPTHPVIHLAPQLTRKNERAYPRPFTPPTHTYPPSLVQ